jgi:hypothetical protein
MTDFRNPRKPAPVRNKDGGRSKFYRPLKENASVKGKSGPHRDGDYEMTEDTMTVKDPSGKFVLVPSIYMNENNKPVQFTKESQAFNAAMNYEQSAGKKFPRFKTPEEAGKFAENVVSLAVLRMGRWLSKIYGDL